MIREGLQSGPEHAWLSRSDAHILAATQVLCGGEHASVTFPVQRLVALLLAPWVLGSQRLKAPIPAHPWWLSLCLTWSC